MSDVKRYIEGLHNLPYGARVVAEADYDALLAERDQLRAELEAIRGQQVPEQRAVVMPERKAYPGPEGFSNAPEWWSRRHTEAKSWNDCLAEFLRLNPHLGKGKDEQP